MVNYNNGKIYKIVCNVTGDIYIGSTTKEYLSQRLTTHRNNYTKYLNGKYCFVTSLKALENDNYDIILLENVNCTNRDELRSRERFYIENNKCVNKVIPGRTDQENRNDTKKKDTKTIKKIN